MSMPGLNPLDAAVSLQVIQSEMPPDIAKHPLMSLSCQKKKKNDLNVTTCLCPLVAVGHPGMEGSANRDAIKSRLRGTTE